MNREVQVRICEQLTGRFRRLTRLGGGGSPGTSLSRLGSRVIAKEIGMNKKSYILTVILICFSQVVIASDLSLCKALNHQSYKPCENLATAGNPDGQFGLGMLLLEGTGVRQDYSKSFDLMYKAAIQGHAEAQLQVGQAYVNGQGVKKDFEEAYAWFLVSKENGNTIADQGIRFMDEKLLIKKHRMSAVTQRANDIYAKTTNKKGFQYAPTESIQPVSGLAEYCDIVMPTVGSVINYKKYGKARSEAQQLMMGMTDQRAIKMMNGVIDWVWGSNIPVEKMNDYFKGKCLTQSPEISFIFP